MGVEDLREQAEYIQRRYRGLGGLRKYNREMVIKLLEQPQPDLDVKELAEILSMTEWDKLIDEEGSYHDG